MWQTIKARDTWQDNVNLSFWAKAQIGGDEIEMTDEFLYPVSHLTSLASSLVTANVTTQTERYKEALWLHYEVDHLQNIDSTVVFFWGSMHLWCLSTEYALRWSLFIYFYFVQMVDEMWSMLMNHESHECLGEVSFKQMYREISLTWCIIKRSSIDPEINRIPFPSFIYRHNNWRILVKQTEENGR